MYVIKVIPWIFPSSEWGCTVTSISYSEWLFDRTHAIMIFKLAIFKLFLLVTMIASV